MQFETETETPPPTEFDRISHEIEVFIRNLRESPYSDETRLSALKGFCGAVAGVPELLREIEAEAPPDDKQWWWAQRVSERDRVLGYIQGFLETCAIRGSGESKRHYAMIEQRELDQILNAIAALYAPPQPTPPFTEDRE
jgi:hypothetical protein